MAGAFERVPIGIPLARLGAGRASDLRGELLADDRAARIGDVEHRAGGDEACDRRSIVGHLGKGISGREGVDDRREAAMNRVRDL